MGDTGFYYPQLPKTAGNVIKPLLFVGTLEASKDSCGLYWDNKVLILAIKVRAVRQRLTSHSLGVERLLNEIHPAKFCIVT